MARIWYEMSADGWGHAIRSKVIIEQLQKDHKVIISCAEPVYSYMKKNFKNVYKTKQSYFLYKNNSGRAFASFWKLVIELFKHISYNFKTTNKILKLKPDIIISDFGPLSCYIGTLRRIPVISLDNNHEMLKTKTKFRLFPKYWWARLGIFLWFPTATHHVIMSFCKRKNNKKVTFITPILRKEVLELKPNNKNYGLVYQTSSSNTELIPILKNSSKQFIVYGMKKVKSKNLTFKAFNEKQFLDDLKNASFVIVNGGFSVITEAIHLQKPLISIPIRSQAEQGFNAAMIKQQGIGMSSERLTSEELELFISNLNKYRKKLNKRNWNQESPIKIIKKVVQEYTPKFQK